MNITRIRKSLVSISVLASLVYSQDVHAGGKKDKSVVSKKTASTSTNTKDRAKVNKERAKILRTEIIKVTGQTLDPSLNYMQLGKEAIHRALMILDSKTEHLPELDKAIRLLEVANENCGLNVIGHDTIRTFSQKLYDIAGGILERIASVKGRVQEKVLLSMILQRAADLGHDRAKTDLRLTYYTLACDYVNGENEFPKDVIKGLDYCEKAVELGNSNAKLLRLHILTELVHEFSTGTSHYTQNLRLAIKYAEQAADLGDVQAKQRLPNLYYELAIEYMSSPSQFNENLLPHDLQLAEQYCRKAIQLGHPYAEKFLEHICQKKAVALSETQDNVVFSAVAPANTIKTVEQENVDNDSNTESQIRKLAMQNDHLAQYTLGELLAKRGEHEEAVEWFKKSYKRENGTTDIEAKDRARHAIGSSSRIIAGLPERGTAEGHKYFRKAWRRKAYTSEELREVLDVE